MSEKISKSPQIRFAGYTDAWEQRKLGDKLKEFSIKTKTENEYPVLSSTNSGMEIRNGRVSGTSNLGYKIIEDGDLVLSPQNLWLGNINVNNIGKGIVSPSYRTFKFIDLDSQFIEPQLRLPRMLEEYKNASTQGASVVRRNLELESFYQIPIRVPSWKEQEKIGSFFKQLEDTLTLYQRELELFKDTKKSLLQKMFPKDGANVPEIRFEGFTDPWEQCKLGEVFEQTSEYVNPKVENLELWSLTVENGLTPKTERYNREFLVKKEDQFKSVSDNEFIYNPMNMTLGAVDLNLTGKKVAVSGYYITMKTTENYDSKYFGIWLKTPLAIKMYKMFATGSLIERQRVQFPTLSQITASVPSKDEQAKIGNFFKQLDDTIALHQRELNSLKNVKKSLLQQMFV
ncbi:restriction endonuclease subunit S [Bacillus sp. SIMBA_031]|uniref:restriction endonuclease subunit S n=2 Tax=Bacteria TaxID=2 RepID=UPI00397BB5EC